MLKQTVQDAINRQINLEFYSAYSYLNMSSYCALKNFPGCAMWLMVQSQEETAHAMRLRQFMIDRDCKVELKAIDAPPPGYESIADVFAKSLEQERSVSKSINDLYELAHQEKAFAALVELQWFITEQVEEEKTAREIVAKFEMVKDDPSALLDLDRELGDRKPDEAGE